jgi:N-acyl-D-amino-acid deacylase
VNHRMLLRGGLVADGIGPTVVRADVLTDGPVIGYIGRDGDAAGASAANCEVIDLAPGSVICPGFIDAHVHAEGPLLETGRVDGALAQGVTTLVVGQDGESWIGAAAATTRYLNQYFGPVNGSLEPVRDLSVTAFRQAVSGRLVQNVAVLASQGTIRHNVAGMAAGPLGPDERAAARQTVEQALAEGAVGLSSGLDYLPSRFGDVHEIAAMAAPLAEAGRPYVSHLRAYGQDVAAGLDELVAVGREAGVRVHASHLWGAPADIAPALEAADAAGCG